MIAQTLDDVVKTIVKEKQNFERLEMKKADLLEMFKYNQFKVIQGYIFWKFKTFKFPHQSQSQCIILPCFFNIN